MTMTNLEHYKVAIYRRQQLETNLTTKLAQLEQEKIRFTAEYHRAYQEINNEVKYYRDLYLTELTEPLIKEVMGDSC